MVPALVSGPLSDGGFDAVMSRHPAERIPAAGRLRSATDFARLKERGRAVRGSYCLLVAESRPGEPTRVAFVASRKGVGDAVRRNRARRRLREIVRRRWPEVVEHGLCMMFVAFRGALTAPHAELVRDVERLLEQAGALAPRESI
jgi:ribonuclease P protein component